MTASLSRDLMAGHPTEVEPVLGDLVERGHRLGLSLPLTALAALALRVHNRRVSAAANLTMDDIRAARDEGRR
jgi:2-dehydropantoate 2-reductase